MTPSLLRIGHGESPVVVVDDASGAVDRIVDLAAALAPYPAAGGHYPGVRRVLAAGDGAAYDYATALLDRVAPFIGGAFAIDGFDWIEASFSIVTAAPQTLTSVQRAPHFDATDEGYIAVLHYLSDQPAGTAFYRQRATGIERVDDGNRAAFLAAARRDGPALDGYINESTAAFEQIGRVDARRDRVVIYQGCLLHSGIIPDDLLLSADPRRGRLTANLFVQAQR